MTWKIVQSSVVGSSHVERGETCQDECFAQVIVTSQGEEYFLALLSDGAGSALNGAKGASIACEEGQKIIQLWLIETSSVSLSYEVIASWIEEIKNRICETANQEGLTLRDYACTFLGAIVGEKRAAYFQIGDGAIVINDDQGYRSVFWPQSGEYINSTFFLTDDNSMSNLSIEITNVPEEIAIFSDGLQNLALVYQSKTVHVPFFSPMFERLRRETQDECDMLSEQLSIFLNSASVLARTDDDKTLILASSKHCDCP